MTKSLFHSSILKFAWCTYLICMVSGASAQRDPASYSEPDEEISQKGFHAGLYIGTYFANSQSANLYDGYGYDFEGNRNTFENSWLNQKINVQFGGSLGLEDLISRELGVPDNTYWNFDESDMPANMRYKTAFEIGFNGRYSTDGKNGVLINVNAAVLKAVGNFTITTILPPNSTQINNSIQTFNISGEEQRLLIQLGYQGISGTGQGMHFLIEGGLHATLSKFGKNEVQINNLIIDLNQDYYDQTGNYTYFTGSRPSGIGFGAFAGVGLHFETNSKWNIQFVYNPLLERVNMGYNRKYKINHSIGLRMYYMLSKRK